MEMESMYLTRWRKILYIKPYYRAEQSSGTVVCYEDGSTEELNVSCRQVINNLARKFYTTAEQARSRSADLLGDDARRKLPLILHERFCLVPFKFREAEQRYDSTLGYVVLHKFRSVSVHPENGCYLQFRKREQELHIPQHYETVRRQLNLARVLMDFYLEE